VSLPSFGSVFSPTKEGESAKLKKNSSEASEKPSQSAKQTSEPPAKKRKRKEKKKTPGQAIGALSLLVQYDSDSTSSCGTHTESDDSSGHSGSPVSGTPSPVVVETSSDSSRHQSLGASQEVSANSVSQLNGGTPKNGGGGGTAHKKRPSNGKSPVEKKKPRGGTTSRGDPHPPLVNLNDTVASMQQLKGGAPNAPMPGNSPCYQVYSSAYPAYPTPGSQYSAAGVSGYALPSFSLPTGSLNFPSPGHSQYAASLPQYYPGDAHHAPPGYSTSPGAYFPQWRTSYAPMQCQGSLPPKFNYANSGNNGKNVYR